MVDVVLERLRRELPELWEYKDIAALAPAGLSAHVAAALDLLQQGFDKSKVVTPPAAVDFACRLAEHGVEISELLRVYRLVHAGLLQLFYEETTRLTKDLELINAVTTTLSAIAFEYVDRSSEQAVSAYQEARDRWMQRRLIMINEAGARIGTTLDIARTAQELADVGTGRFADRVTVDLLDSVFREEETHSAPAAPTLRRIAQSISDGSPDTAMVTGQVRSCPEGSAPARVLATGQPLRLRVTASAAPAWLEGPADHENASRSHGTHSMLLVPLRARGNALGIAQFFRQQTADPFDDDDLLLAQEIASRAAVNIDNARRYTQERSTALTLQRSLLPQHAPDESAVETASRYLPSGSRAGVGGDWYDVIPLSGARVALVVGDVIGRGLQAAATMGRLRTAVRTLADIDLTPDELLTHLDDVVIRLQRVEESGMDEISATCLYAVYDPVSQLCSLASAGHVLPAVVTSGDGQSARAVAFPELPIGPPLGLGGLPFETAQFELPQDSLLVLFTDGLIDSRARDVDASLALLRDVLAGATGSLEQTCDGLLQALLPGRPVDDVALLVARPRALDAGHVATLDPPPPTPQSSPTRACSLPTSWPRGDWRSWPSPRSSWSANW